MAEIKPKRKISISDTLESHKIGDFTVFEKKYYNAASRAANSLKAKGVGSWRVDSCTGDDNTFKIIRES